MHMMALGSWQRAAGMGHSGSFESTESRVIESIYFKGGKLPVDEGFIQADGS